MKKTIRFEKETELHVYLSLRENKYFLCVEEKGERLELSKDQAMKFKNK